MVYDTTKIYKLVSNYNNLSREIKKLRTMCVYKHSSSLLIDSLNGQENQIDYEMNEIFEQLVVAVGGNVNDAFDCLEGKIKC